MEMPELGKLHQGISYDDYSSIKGIRASWLYGLKISPQHFKMKLEQPDEDTPAKRLGRLVHSLFENGEKFMDTYIVEPVFVGKTKDGRDSTRSAEAKEKKEEWYKNINSDAIVVTPDELEVLTGIANTVRGSKMLTKMLHNSIRESSIWVKDDETDEILQCRPDFITERGYILDIKTYGKYAKDFQREIFSDGPNSRFYVLACAHYVKCLKLAGITKTDNMTLLAIETKPPYGMIPYNLDLGCLGPGEQWRSHLTKLYAECKAANSWPGYPDKVVPATIPNWVSLPPEDDDVE